MEEVLDNMQFRYEEYLDLVLNKKFTFLYDKQGFLFSVLVNWVLESDFNIDYLSKFDDFRPVWKYLTFISNYEFYER